MDKLIENKLVRYQRFRSSQRNLNKILPEQLPKNALIDCGKKLGIYRDDSLVLGSEYELSVLMDYCIYDFRWEGQNSIERYLSQACIDTESDEGILINAMLHARYSLFAVTEVKKGVGIQTQDLLMGDSGFIFDIALSETAVTGFVLASRIISPGKGNFSMTTGAGLPVDATALKILAKDISEQFGERTDDIYRLSPDKKAELSAHVIRHLLASDASSYISEEAATTERTEKDKPKVGRNDPCSCGSGKKYKRCCGVANNGILAY